jgi:hypothetical protein
MNKVSGKKSDFSYMREEGSRIVIGYGLDDDTFHWAIPIRHHTAHNNLSCRFAGIYGE